MTTCDYGEAMTHSVLSTLVDFSYALRPFPGAIVSLPMASYLQLTESLRADAGEMLTRKIEYPRVYGGIEILGIRYEPR